MIQNAKRKISQLTVIILLSIVIVSCNNEKTTTTYYTNPILLEGADPYVYLHTDGYYYTLVTRGKKIQVWKSSSFTNLAEGETKDIWFPPKEGENSALIWAPEIHYFDNTWYIYYTATDILNPVDMNRHVFVLKNISENPFEGSWENLGKVETLFPGIDGHIFEYKGVRYFAYSPYIGSQSGINLAKLISPTKIENEISLGLPVYDWEKTPPREILEGPQFLEGPGDKIFLIYSAGACWDDNYGLGFFSTNVDSNLLDPKSWTRSGKQVFSQSPENSVYGPGHNCFTKSPDGEEDWIVYHAKPESSTECSKRSMRAQTFTWDKNGVPSFGKPEALSTKIPVPSGL